MVLNFFNAVNCSLDSVQMTLPILSHAGMKSYLDWPFDYFLFYRGITQTLLMLRESLINTCFHHQDKSFPFIFLISTPFLSCTYSLVCLGFFVLVFFHLALYPCKSPTKPSCWCSIGKILIVFLRIFPLYVDLLMCCPRTHFHYTPRA